MSTEESAARAFVEELSKGAFAHPATTFSAEMAEALPPAKLEAAWRKLEEDAGRLVAIDATRVEEKPPFKVVLATCRFERARKRLRVTLDARDAVAGFFYGPVPEELEARSRAVIDAAERGDFTAASRDFAPVLASAMPPAAFARVWKGLEDKLGRVQSIEGVELAPEAGAWVSLVTARLERERVAFKIVYDPRDAIVGFFVVPPKVAWTPPPYANGDAFEEREVKVGPIPLPGVLTLPKASGPKPPAIVLVHGSGPQDQDEQVGAIKVFKDLAWGLASRGVAVLRYAKRTKIKPAGVVTEKEEVVDGARDAIALLRATPEVDPKRIFVLGHSQGGGLAPRIAKEEPDLAGVVILAGPTRSLQDILIDQLALLAPAKVEAARAFKRAVEDPKLRADEDVDFPTGGSAKGAYFLEQRGYHPELVLQGLACRVLVLQGERDYQVTMVDLDGWRRALARRANATIKTYPALDHAFVAGTGPSRPEDYERPGHVDATVIADLAQWLTR